MENMFFNIILAILGLIVLVVFFHIPARILNVFNNTKKTNQFLVSLLELKEQELKSKGIEPKYFIQNNKYKVLNKKTNEIKEMNKVEWEVLKKSEDKDNFELVPFDVSAKDF